MENKKIYWHLPGFYMFFNLNQVIINLMNTKPDLFRDDYAVGSVYGTFPGAIWNGGRAVFGTTQKSVMESVITTYNRAGVPVRFTWTNSLLEEKHIYDTYCNLIMEVANNGKNQVLVNKPVLEEYLKKTYPDFEYISSTTKRITSVDDIKKELERDYKLVVLDYDLNHDEETLKALEPAADRIEILVNEICFPGCPRRKDHYEAESRAQLIFDAGNPFTCHNLKDKPCLAESMKRPAFISADDVAAYADRGFVNFKIVGRGLPPEMAKESYVYFLAKEDKRDEVSRLIESELKKFVRK
ncbi:MAG: hypothetical protein K6G57_07415 [Lachnospiraceae bacterium]|nr:hypothetical protein [Lachnospiraceae bacterium]